MKHPENMTQAELLVLVGEGPVGWLGDRRVHPVCVDFTEAEADHQERYADWLARHTLASALGRTEPVPMPIRTLTPWAHVTVERSTGLATYKRIAMGGEP